METCAGQLAAFAFVEKVLGAGEIGLATIIGEAGDLSNYANPGKLWSRLGYAPYRGFAGSSWKRDSWHQGEKALSKEEWTDHPFSGERYALMYAISDSMLRAQKTKKTEDSPGEAKGPYGQIYMDRRRRTAETHPDWTDGHSHKDALRVMMKAYLRDLWVAWNRAENPRFVYKPWNDR